ncbi:MAG: terminase family protein [Methanobacteriaceae archaeon]|jgi:phage terminase large subunit-like protein|nr:terminase family protein [Methanobacteriaceae archaeon]
MRINYSKSSLDYNQKKLLQRTIFKNPFIPVKPYNRQLYAIASRSKRKLLGGSAWSGKSMLGAILALQHFEVPNYRCLIVRRTYDDVIATGGIVEYINEWTQAFPYIEWNQSKRVFINHKNNAKIFYSYMLHEKDKNKFKSRAYHKIIVDEASELFEICLRFLNRSLRPTAGLTKFPLALYYISNPSEGEGSQYLNDKFVKGEFPFFEMNLWHNPYVKDERESYLENLKELSPADYQYQIGNWDYERKSGDVFDYDLIWDHSISKQEYDELLTEWDVVNKVLSWDIANTEKPRADYTAYSKSTIFKEKIAVINGQDSFKKNPGKLEKSMKRVMDQNDDHVNWIEKQPAMAGKQLTKYWTVEFEEYNTKFIPVYKNKSIRAGRVVPKINQEKILFVKNKWLKTFIKQAVKFPSEKLISNDESTHDDRVDSVSLLVEGLYPSIPITKLRKRKRSEI